MGRQQKKDDLGECAYCGAQATTKDHIPPQGTYAKGWPNKPWVPACESCNKAASQDDEYMQRFSMLWGADGCKDAEEIGDKFLRSLERPEARGLEAELLQSLSPIEDESRFPGGTNIALKGSRLERITDKLVRGWWFKLSGTRVPDGHRIMKYVPPAKQHENALFKRNEKLIVTCPGFYLGDNAFGFRLAYCPGTLMTCWLFEFYKVFKIMAYTCEWHDETFRIVDLRNPHAVINFDGDGPKIMALGKTVEI
jgi:hypothetical protein